MKVLVTGASGSFGRAFIRRLLEDDLAEKVVAYARGEHRLAELVEIVGHDPRLLTLIGDVRDARRLHDALHRVDTVVHSAALKRVAGTDPMELYQTNIEGTINVVRATSERQVPRLLLLSSDKAVQPCTPYGFSKAAAEAYAIYANAFGHPTTRISALRYGNVHASQGSVIHLWRRQLADGEPLTLTDPECTRFWLTMEVAVDIVLRTLQQMHGGEVVIPLLPALRLGDLAEAVASHYQSKVVGRRAGEKRHEVLLSEDESERAVLVPGLGFVLAPADPGWPWRPWAGEPLQPGFRYASNTVPLMTLEDIRALLGRSPA